MVEVAAGPFLMGCNEAVDDDCYSDEYPYHEVDVPGFAIDRTEVTNAAYAEFLTAHGNDCDGGECVAAGDLDLRLGESGGTWSADGGYADHPVVEVTWYGARGYCAWVGKRLCSESEREKAARGTDGRIYPCGDEEPGPTLVNCSESVCGDGYYGGTAPVGSFSAGASPYGALDLAGNVWEWTEDDWHGSYGGAPSDGSAWVDSPRAGFRVVRGGGWVIYAVSLRASNRVDYYPAYGDYVIGLRCCRSSY